MNRMSVRGIAVASATAVTTVGAAVGVASGEDRGGVETTDELEFVAADDTLLSEIPAGTNAALHTSALTQQAEAQSVAAAAEALRTAQETARIQAAEQASERKAAEERAEREAAEREAAEREAAEREAAANASVTATQETADASSYPLQSSYSTAEVQAMAQEMVPADQFQCFSSIVEHESGWDYTATNPSSGAYGLMQALPGDKMASAGADWRTNPATQIEWGLTYMEERYGSPCGAWDFWQVNNWY